MSRFVAHYQKWIEQRIQTAVHDCPGLTHCEDHPRWHVWKTKNLPVTYWTVWAADGIPTLKRFPTHAEAIQ